MVARKSSKDSLEHSLRRLEEIVDTLEKGTVSLDEAMDLYEEGVRISSECAEKLKSAELRIKKLTKDIEGKFSFTEPEEE